jgi:hypothetical protein
MPKEVLFMGKEKKEKKGLFGFLKRAQSSGCCDMKIVEVSKEEESKKGGGCCSFEIVPADEKE